MGLPRVRIGRWPRRLAALSCLALAGLAAVRPTTGAPGPAPARPSPVAGQRAVPVTVAGDPHQYLATGDAVELLAAPAAGGPTAFDGPPPSAAASVVAARATVLAIPAAAAPAGDTGWPLIVGVDESTARRLAALAGQPVLAVVTGPP